MMKTELIGQAEQCHDASRSDDSWKSNQSFVSLIFTEADSDQTACSPLGFLLIGFYHVGTESLFEFTESCCGFILSGTELAIP